MLSTNPKTCTPAWLSSRIRWASARLRPQTASTWTSRGERASAAAYFRKGSVPSPPPVSSTVGAWGRNRSRSRIEVLSVK